MPDPIERVVLSSMTARTRLVAISVFFGAMIAMSLSWVFSWGPETDSEQDRAEREAERVAETRTNAFRSPPGSCLDWDAPDAGDAHQVDCDQEHLFEVAGAADLSGEHSPEAPIPDDDAWQELTEQHCGDIVHDYLDTPLDPQGKLTIGVLHPNVQQWEDGDRMLHCGIQSTGPGGELQQLGAPAVELDQSDVWEPGTCLALEDKTVGDPITCSEPHAYEITGLIDLRDEFDDFPTADDQKEWLDQQCSDITEEYTGGRDLEEDDLLMSWDVREEESWDAGSTRVNCKVGAVLPDDTGLAPVHESVKENDDATASDKDDDSTESEEDDTEPESGDE